MQPNLKKTFEGLVDISNEEYHSSAGISRSGIMEFRICPKKYWYKYICPDYIEKPATPEMNFGTAFHSMILEPEKFETDYFRFEKIDRRSNAGKAAYEDMLKRAEGKIILDDEQIATLEGMRASLWTDPVAVAYISGALYEKSIYWVDKETGILCKCRPDILHRKFVVDLKTTKDASFFDFQRVFYNKGYHIQLAMIKEGCESIGYEIEAFVDLCVEKEPPYCHNIFDIHNEAIEIGQREFHKALCELKQCMDKNYYPSYMPPEFLTLPKYALSQGE